MDHLSIERALAYVAGKVTEEESFWIETHLADCDECARRIYNYNIIKENFDEIWDSWTAKSHAQALFQAHFLESLQKAEVPARLQERIKEWAKNVFQKTGAILNVVFSFPDKTVKIAQEGLEKFCRPGFSLQFFPVAVPSFVRGEAKRFSRSVETQGSPWIKVTADPTGRRISIQTERIEKPWPLVILKPKTGGAIVGEFYRPAETDYLLSEFEDVPDGEFFLMFEFLERNEKESQ